MLAFDVRMDIAAAIRGLTELERKQVPFALARGLTQTARDIHGGLAEAMPAVFDRPTRWTTGAYFVKPATKKDLVATVMSRQFAGKGTPAAAMLRHHIEGGTRKPKMFESRLQAVGIMDSGTFGTMGRDVAEKDAYGNIPAAKYVSMLSALKAHTDSRAYMNRTGKFGKGKRGKEIYFIGGRGRAKHLAPGIYQHFGYFGKAIKPTYMFVSKAPAYRARFPFAAISERISRGRLVVNFLTALDAAFKTARGGPIRSPYVGHMKAQAESASTDPRSLARGVLSDLER